MIELISIGEVLGSFGDLSTHKTVSGVGRFELVNTQELKRKKSTSFNTVLPTR